MKAAPPEIGAALHHLCVCSPEPRRLEAFLKQALGTERHSTLVVGGPANKVAFAAFAFRDRAALQAHKARLTHRGLPVRPNPSPLFDDQGMSVTDPDGNVIAFGIAAQRQWGGRLSARLQHVVFRTSNIEGMVAFYEDALGFIVSDRVKDESGRLRACFLRSDAEHHSLAVFHSLETRLDHQSYETGDWNDIRRWADYMSEHRIPIFWGVGRHGPGNDLFFMVKDPDGNLLEISAEIEVCAPDRPEGLWPHEQRTLNVWGNAIMRS